MSKIKKGDLLLAHTDLPMDHDENLITKGKYYTVIDINNNIVYGGFEIKNDLGQGHIFTVDRMGDWFYYVGDEPLMDVGRIMDDYLNEGVLSEGRYDTLTKTVSKDILKCIIMSEPFINKEKYFDLPHDIKNEFTYTQGNIEFSVELSITHTDEFEDIFEKRTDLEDQDVSYYLPKGFFIQTSIADTDPYDEGYFILIQIFIDTKEKRNYYEKLYFKIQEDIRHEIEHFTQMFGPSRISDRPVYKGSTAQLKTTYGHHKNVIEIPALVHGFYRRAKIERKGLDEIMIDDLDHEIKMGNLTKKQANSLLTIWLDYAMKNLPSALYKKEGYRF